MREKRYHWQPELATSIIYWSITLCVLFYSLTLALEKTGPYWKSNLVLLVFLFLAFRGCKRVMNFTGKSLQVHYAQPFKVRKFELQNISQLTLHLNGISFSYQGKEEFFLFRKKVLVLLKEELEKHFTKEEILIKNEKISH